MKIQENRPSTLKKNAGIIAGAAVGLAPMMLMAGAALRPFDESRLDKIKSLDKKIFPDFGHYNDIMRSANDVLVKTGLADQGVKIYNINVILDTDSKLPEPKNFFQKIRMQQYSKFMGMIKKGLNACYNPKNKHILVSTEGHYSSVFHEIGHALNNNSNGFMKVLQKARRISPKMLPIAGLGTLAVGLFHKKNDTQQKQKKINILDFIHNNTSKIMFTIFCPVMLEETVASFKGIQLAKKYLSKAQRQQHIKNNVVALSSYLIKPIIFANSIRLGLFVKGKIADKK